MSLLTRRWLELKVWWHRRQTARRRLAELLSYRTPGILWWEKKWKEEGVSFEPGRYEGQWDEEWRQADLMDRERLRKSQAEAREEEIKRWINHKEFWK